MADYEVFTKVIGSKAIIVTTNDKVDEKRFENNDFFGIKVIDLYDDDCETNNWSLNTNVDMGIVIKALVTGNYELLALGSEHLIAFRNDLLDNGIIYQEEYDEIDRLRRNKKPRMVI